MPVQKYIERILYIDSLIRKKATGSARQLAKKLHLSEPSVMKHIRAMKDLGCPIKYCRKRNSYYYHEDGKVIISFFDKRLNKAEEVGGVKAVR